MASLGHSELMSPVAAVVIFMTEPPWFHQENNQTFAMVRTSIGLAFLLLCALTDNQVVISMAEEGNSLVQYYNVHRDLEKQ